MSAREPQRRAKNAARTRAEILHAAALAFSDRGYAQSGVREIAARVGVNQALVTRYFGSKENLFSAALGAALDVNPLLATARESFGRHVTEILCADAPGGLNPTSMMVLATADPDAKAATERLLEERVTGQLEDWLGPPHAAARAALITVLCTGFVIYRKLLPMQPLAGGTNSDAAAWLADALQALADGRGFDGPV